MASAFPLFGRAFFHKLGLGGGSSLLAGLSILMIPLYYVSSSLQTCGCSLTLMSRCSFGMARTCELGHDMQLRNEMQHTRDGIHVK